MICSPGPGDYENCRQFGLDGFFYTINGEERRTTLQRTPGPGTYDHERADSLTKPRGLEIDFGNQLGRKPNSIDPLNGPGS